MGPGAGVTGREGVVTGGACVAGGTEVGPTGPKIIGVDVGALVGTAGLLPGPTGLNVG